MKTLFLVSLLAFDSSRLAFAQTKSDATDLAF